MLLPVTLALLFAAAQAEVFTAMADLQLLLKGESTVSDVVDEYIAAERRRLDVLKKTATKYQEKYKRLSDKEVFDSEISNPISAFQLVKELTTLQDRLKSNLADDFINNITKRRSNAAVQFPGREDMDGAATALIRLQDTYNLDARSMANGKISGAKQVDKLTAEDCFDVAKVAYNSQDYYHTIIWTQEAIDRLDQEERAGEETVVDRAEALEYLAFSLYQQGNLRRALHLTKQVLKLDPEHPRAADSIEWYEKELKDAGQKDKGALPPVTNPRPYDWKSKEEQVNYERLCRGEVIMNPKEEATMYCYLKRNRPYLLLAPIRVEILHWKPKVVIFRDVISDKEMAEIQEISTPLLQRATAYHSASKTFRPANYRISKSAWLNYKDYDLVNTIDRRIEYMTDLSCGPRHAEDLQIANYGIGGHYDVHFDMSTAKEEDEEGAFQDDMRNRIATVLFYMSEPLAGGSTVFVDMKIGVRPTKGDAVFWHNVRQDGVPDENTKHAACPVLAGQKWVSNKWIHENGQEFGTAGVNHDLGRQCLLDKNNYE